MTVFWSARAIEDVERIVEYISYDNPAAGSRIGRELLIAGDSLSMFPRRGRLASRPGFRELVAVPPYVIVYQVLVDDTVRIIRVWHAAQDRWR